MIPWVLRPIRHLFRLIIYVIGWHGVNLNYVNHLTTKYPHAILVFQHTSNWDFGLLLLYALAYPNVFNNVWAAMKPQLFSNPVLSWIFTKLHFIPSTKLEEGGLSFTDRVKDLITSQDSCYFLIAPDGMRNKSEWRSGYYWCAVKSQCPFIVCGFDYNQNYLVINNALTLKENKDNEYYKETKHDIEQLAKKLAGRITPLHPELSSVLLSNPDKPTMLCDMIQLLSFFTLIGYYYRCLYGPWHTYLKFVSLYLVTLYYMYGMDGHRLLAITERKMLNTGYFELITLYCLIFNYYHWGVIVIALMSIINSMISNSSYAMVSSSYRLFIACNMYYLI